MFLLPVWLCVRSRECVAAAVRNDADADSVHVVRTESTFFHLRYYKNVHEFFFRESLAVLIAEPKARVLVLFFKAVFASIIFATKQFAISDWVFCLDVFAPRFSLISSAH